MNTSTTSSPFKERVTYVKHLNTRVEATDSGIIYIPSDYIRDNYGPLIDNLDEKAFLKRRLVKTGDRQYIESYNEAGELLETIEDIDRCDRILNLPLQEIVAERMYNIVDPNFDKKF